MILPCNCKHEFQDRVYGKGMRLHNRAKAKDGGEAWRCTVCASLKTTAGPQKAKEAKKAA